MGGETMDTNGNEIALSKRSVKGIGHRFNDRITDDAALRVALELEKRAEDTFRCAEMFANHAGRKTIKEEDIMKVMKMRDEL
jgi:histone H3/H4